MFLKIRFLLLGIALFILVGCGGGPVEPQISPVDSNTVTTTMFYRDRLEAGPVYNVSITLPDEWVGQFQLRNRENVIFFDYVGESDKASPIFSIEALSSYQYWKQSGYPGYYTNIVNKGDTYFVYHLPIDPYYSGLAEETFVTFSTAVPEIIQSVAVSAAN